MAVRIAVLGPVGAEDDQGRALVVGSVRRRELLARLTASGGRVVPLGGLVADLWEDPPPTAEGTVRTFVAELRSALEPGRRPRAASQVIRTVGTGYALAVDRSRVDALRFEDAVGAARREPDPRRVVDGLDDALSWWAGEPFADLRPAPWVTAERTRLTELRTQAVELRAERLLELGQGAGLVAELGELAGTHPWRERGWALLAHALYQAGRQVDALATVREARARLAEAFGLDAVPGLDRLERAILEHAPHLDPAPSGDDGRRLLASAATRGSGTRLSQVGAVARTAALAGGPSLVLAQAQRAAAVAEAARTGDTLLTARVIAAYDVPTIWTRSDDPVQAAALVRTARDVVVGLPAEVAPTLRARVLATIGIEHRGSRDAWAAEAAGEAERIAREVGDPALLLLALDARFVQSFQTPGGTAERTRIATEILDVAPRHDLAAFEILGHLIALQVHGARGTYADAEPHLAAADRLAVDHESPLVHVMTAGFRALTCAEHSRDPAEALGRYAALARDLDASGMPGVADGFWPLALLSVHLRHGLPVPDDPELDWGPYRPWVDPLLLAARGDLAAAHRSAAVVPDPAADHLAGALWAVAAHAAVMLDHRDLAARARAGLEPLNGETAGGVSGLISLGPVDDLLARLEAAGRRSSADLP